MRSFFRWVEKKDNVKRYFISTDNFGRFQIYLWFIRFQFFQYIYIPYAWYKEQFKYLYINIHPLSSKYFQVVRAYLK